MVHRPNTYQSQHRRDGAGSSRGRDDWFAEAVGKIVDNLQNGDFVGVVRALDRVKKSGDKESKTALRKLFETVKHFAEKSGDSNRAAARIYAAVSHVAARQNTPFIQVAKAVADRYLIHGSGDLKDRVERFVLFMEILVSTVG